jgi:protein MAK16
MLAPGPKTVTGMAPKRVRWEETRERKALAAAKLEKEIERELVNRLKSGNYTEDMLNVNEEIWKKVLDQRARAECGEVAEEEEEEDEVEGEVEFVSDDEGIMSDDEEFNDWLQDGEEVASDFEESEDDEDEDEEEAEMEVNGKQKLAMNGNIQRRKVAWVEVEYEEEHENHPQNELAFA